MKEQLIEKDFLNKKILIVEDDIISLNIVKTILQHNNFKNIFIANNAKDAFKIIEKEDIFLVLMNYKMSDINGIEACEYITKNIDVPNHSSIIIITSSINNYTIKNSFEAGAVDFISKPINPFELVARIQNVLKTKIQLEKEIKNGLKLQTINQSLQEIIFKKEN